MSERREPRERDVEQTTGQPEPETEPGSAISRGAEPERPATSQTERASEPGELPPDQPDEGWQEWPGGHRQGRAADHDLQRRKG